MQPRSPAPVFPPSSPAVSTPSPSSPRRRGCIAAGVCAALLAGGAWIPASAGTTGDGAGMTEEATGPLHVPSPDWRDQVIYFAMIDRFDDGDPSNNDQGAAEYDPADAAKFSGGDLRGLQRRV